MDISSIEQLLTLNCIIYSLEFASKEKSSKFLGKTVYEWSKSFKYNLLENNEAPGGISTHEFETLITTIQKDREFYDKVEIVDIENSKAGNTDGTFKIVNVTFKYENNLLVIYKGTSGVLEWNDNVKGMYDDVSSTIQQIEALKYFDYVCEKFENQFDNIYVSGHSKGGNKAQYVCVFRGDKDNFIKAYSFDGQGFNLRFLGENKEKIENVKDKIISISNEYDFVNILSNRIAGENIYIKSNTSVGDGISVEDKFIHHFGGWHSPYSMFIFNEDKGELKLNEKVPQSNLMAKLERLFKYYEKNMDYEDRMYSYDVLALEMKRWVQEGYDEELVMPTGFIQRLIKHTINCIKDDDEIGYLDAIVLLRPIFKDLKSIIIKGDIVENC